MLPMDDENVVAKDTHSIADIADGFYCSSPD